METNELPEEVKRIINDACNHMRDEFMTIDEMNQWRNGAEFGYRLALQSKEEELAGLKDEIETAREWMKVHEGENSKYLQIQEQLKHLEKINKRTAGMYSELQEQLKAKDEELAKLKKANDGWENADTIKDMNALIDSLTSENNELKKRLSEIEKPT